MNDQETALFRKSADTLKAHFRELSAQG
jgi:hypothetical protein